MCVLREVVFQVRKFTEEEGMFLIDAMLTTQFSFPSQIGDKRTPFSTLL